MLLEASFLHEAAEHTLQRTTVDRQVCRHVLRTPNRQRRTGAPQRRVQGELVTHLCSKRWHKTLRKARKHEHTGGKRAQQGNESAGASCTSAKHGAFGSKRPPLYEAGHQASRAPSCSRFNLLREGTQQPRCAHTSSSTHTHKSRAKARVRTHKHTRTRTHAHTIRTTCCQRHQNRRARAPHDMAQHLARVVWDSGCVHHQDRTLAPALRHRTHGRTRVGARLYPLARGA